MRPLAVILLILPAVCACTTPQGASKKSVDAVVQDESQRQKVLDAIQKGDTPDQALAKVADGPKTEETSPH